MDINELADVVGENEALNPLMDAVTQIMNFNEDLLTPSVTDGLERTIRNMVTDEMMATSEKEIINSMEARNLNRASAREYLASMNNDIKDIFETLKPSEKKEKLLHAVFDPISKVFENAIEHYHTFDIELPIKLEENGHVPTYAHDTDAAADLYAAETVVVPAHSLGNIIPTGIKIALPENWTAYIVPRSSMGVKTPLRLSNSVGVIDSDYRGPVGVIYDNISDSDYTINAGDRIAQLIVMPTYRFKAQVVDILPATERGEGGFGSSGK